MISVILTFDDDIDGDNDDDIVHRRYANTDQDGPDGDSDGLCDDDNDGCLDMKMMVYLVKIQT